MFSCNLKRFREIKGVSQESLANSMEVTKQTISKWENNKTYPTIFQLMCLVDFFSCTPNDLLLNDKVDLDMSFDVFSKKIIKVESVIFNLSVWEFISDYDRFFSLIEKNKV